VEASRCGQHQFPYICRSGTVRVPRGLPAAGKKLFIKSVSLVRMETHFPPKEKGRGREKRKSQGKGKDYCTSLGWV
jgi:hypothetical protein